MASITESSAFPYFVGIIVILLTAVGYYLLDKYILKHK